jgi:hypothetical protein
MKYSEQDISLLMGNVEEVSTVVFATLSSIYRGVPDPNPDPHRIYMFLGLPDPHSNPLVRDMYPDPDPSIIKQM